MQIFMHGGAFNTVVGAEVVAVRFVVGGDGGCVAPKQGFQNLMVGEPFELDERTMVLSR